jgi:hypothetical protein
VQLLKKKEKEEKVKGKRPAKSVMEQPIIADGQPSKWKTQSDAFRQAMRNARMYTQAEANGVKLPPPLASAPDPSLVLCPHCDRRFNEKAAERHIPKCLDIRAKPSTLKKGGGGGGGIQA